MLLITAFVLFIYTSILLVVVFSCFCRGLFFAVVVHVFVVVIVVVVASRSMLLSLPQMAHQIILQGKMFLLIFD
jgi:hypothetical protein